MNKTIFTVLSIVVMCCNAQRSPYAGKSPIGYPALASTTTTVDSLGNRFGDDTPSTTITLPLEALGDVELYKKFSQLPLNEQPFWFINWKALKANRDNPQTFTQKKNNFIN